MAKKWVGWKDKKKQVCIELEEKAQWMPAWMAIVLHGKEKKRPPQSRIKWRRRRRRRRGKENGKIKGGQTRLDLCQPSGGCIDDSAPHPSRSTITRLVHSNGPIHLLLSFIIAINWTLNSSRIEALSDYFLFLLFICVISFFFVVVIELPFEFRLIPHWLSWIQSCSGFDFISSDSFNLAVLPIKFGFNPMRLISIPLSCFTSLTTWRERWECRVERRKSRGEEGRERGGNVVDLQMRRVFGSMTHSNMPCVFLLTNGSWIDLNLSR